MTTVTFAVIATQPETPVNTYQLSDICGHPISCMRLRGGIVELDFEDDHEPDDAMKSLLREAIELGC